MRMLVRLFCGATCVVLGCWAGLDAAAQDGPALEDSAAAVAPVASALTLEEMVLHGGMILWALMALGFAALVLGFYLFLTVSPAREAPLKMTRRAAEQIRQGDIRGACQMCEGRPELLAKVLLSGLKLSGEERYVIQESMEGEGERGATALWQRISYMNNIGVIAPLMGLLGTVWGMIGAFGAMALDDAQVKSLTMAYQVSKAMTTTAAGLLVAIPALVAYYYLRGRVVKIVAQVEAQASEFVELIVRNNRS